jgi:recF protein
MIKSVKLQNFRIHDNYETNFTDKINIIIGNNGAGKTSVIEAIYISQTGKSWRSNFDSITKQNKQWWRVDIKDEDINKNIKFDNKKSFEINNKKYSSLPKKHKGSVVLFEPDNLNLLYGSPGQRRRWLDKLLNDIDIECNLILNKFEKVLKQRNFLLKNQSTSEKLFVWDLQFADLASQIIKKRIDMINIINKKIPTEYERISNKKDSVKMEYVFDNVYTKQDILNQLQNNHNLESITGNTSIGPQKHDILFKFKNQPAAVSASRGENRSIILALKNIEYQIKKNNQSNPLILLDDIMSELDENHQKSILEAFKDSQVIITSVGLLNIKNDVNVIKIS